MKKYFFIFFSTLFFLYVIIPIMWCCMFGFTIWFVHKGDIKPFLKPVVHYGEYLKPILIRTSLTKENYYREVPNN
jgi:hypothetical protein